MNIVQASSLFSQQQQIQEQQQQLQIQQLQNIQQQATTTKSIIGYIIIKTTTRATIS